MMVLLRKNIAPSFNDIQPSETYILEVLPCRGGCTKASHLCAYFILYQNCIIFGTIPKLDYSAPLKEAHV